MKSFKIPRKRVINVAQQYYVTFAEEIDQYYYHIESKSEFRNLEYFENNNIQGICNSCEPWHGLFYIYVLVEAENMNEALERAIVNLFTFAVTQCMGNKFEKITKMMCQNCQGLLFGTPILFNFDQVNDINRSILSNFLPVSQKLYEGQNDAIAKAVISMISKANILISQVVKKKISKQICPECQKKL